VEHIAGDARKKRTGKMKLRFKGEMSNANYRVTSEGVTGGKFSVMLNAEELSGWIVALSDQLANGEVIGFNVEVID
jgi:hypothetical protein